MNPLILSGVQQFQPDGMRPRILPLQSDRVEPLLRAAVVVLQFVSIHPQPIAIVPSAVEATIDAYREPVAARGGGL